MDPIKTGMFKAAADHFQRECQKIDQLLDKMMQEAFAAVLRGDLAERDRICADIERAHRATAAAKREIGLRIADRLGLDRDRVEEALNRELRKQ